MAIVSILVGLSITAGVAYVVQYSVWPYVYVTHVFRQSALSRY